ncbi:MAG: hypothetical protein AB8I08_19255 [Sandaracinaceae bacterium]
MSDARWFDPILKHPLARGAAGTLAAAGAATMLLGASPAEAQTDVTPYGAGGVFVGYQWGPDGSAGSGALWGIEGRGGVVVHDRWNSGPGFAGNAVARFSFVNLDPQFHAGIQAGGGIAWVVGMAEVTLGHRWGAHGGFSMPIGLELQVYAASSFVRLDPVLWQGAVGGGVSWLPREISVQLAVPGRPLHAEDGHAALPSVKREALGAPPSEMDVDTARALEAEWTHRARGEWASVPAFLQLAEQLTSVGAPAALVQRARAAADDELRHAIATARASMVYGGAPLTLGAVTPHTRAPAHGLDALRRLAVESWVDGCLGEGKAAAAVRQESSLAPCEAQQNMQATIANDEAQHAELAWDVLRWTVERGGDDVRHAVHACREAAPAERTSGLDDDVDVRAYGLLPEQEHARIATGVQERAVGRLDALLRS